MKFRKHIAVSAQPASRGNRGQARQADSLERAHKVSWKAALDTIALPAFRLHRYRNVHNRLLQDAWCQLDCHDSGDRSA